MRFFIPEIGSDEQAEEIHQAVRMHLTEVVGAECSEDRFFSLHYRHKGKNYLAEVGKPHAYGETILVILYEPLRRLYHVCTPNRGVLRGDSILVGEHEVQSTVRFETSPTQAEAAGGS